MIYLFHLVSSRNCNLSVPELETNCQHKAMKCFVAAVVRWEMRNRLTFIAHQEGDVPRGSMWIHVDPCGSILAHVVYTTIYYHTSTRASRRRKFPKNKWPIVRRQPVPTVSFPRQAAFFFSERRSKVFTLHTPHFTLHSSHSKLQTSHSTLHTSHFTLHSPHFALLTSHCFLHTPNLTLHTSHFTLRSSHSKLKLHTPHFTLHTPHFTLLTSHCFLHTSHFTLHSSRPTLHTALNLRATKTRWSPRTRMLTRMLMVQMSKHMVMQSRTIPFCNSLFEQSCTCFPCYQSAVWSGKCRVWSVECEV